MEVQSITYRMKNRLGILPLSLANKQDDVILNEVEQAPERGVA